MITLGNLEVDKPDQEGTEDKLEGFEGSQKMDTLEEGVVGNLVEDNR